MTHHPVTIRDYLCEETSGALYALRKMRSLGQITVAAYQKMVVKLAYEVGREGRLDETITLIQTLPYSYFTDDHYQHMIDDPDFMQKCVYIAEAVERYVTPAQEEQMHYNVPGVGQA